MKFINLTPHAITIITEKDGNEVKWIFEPSGTIARVEAVTKKTGEIDGIPITSTIFGEIIGIPMFSSLDTAYIVSSLVAQHPSLKDRRDIFVPNESIRDDKGRIIGCRSLGRI